MLEKKWNKQELGQEEGQLIVGMGTKRIQVFSHDLGKTSQKKVMAKILLINLLVIT